MHYLELEYIETTATNHLNWQLSAILKEVKNLLPSWQS